MSTAEVVRLDCGALSAEISLWGAEPVHVRYLGEERLWQNENGAWPGHAPVLFPVCGACETVFGGQHYPVGKHGFARRMLFSRTAQTERSVCMELRADDATRARYPFEFLLAVTYELRESALVAVFEVENHGNTPMPFACGGHISHALAAPFEDHLLVFSEREQFRALLHDDRGHLTGQTADMGGGNELALLEKDFENGRTVILPSVRSRAVRLISRTQGPLAELAFEGFGNLLLWRAERGARMLCIEPWQNLPDGPADGEREFCEKAGVCTLAPGARARFVQTVTYFSPNT